MLWVYTFEALTHVKILRLFVFPRESRVHQEGPADDVEWQKLISSGVTARLDLERPVESKDRIDFKDPVDSEDLLGSEYRLDSRLAGSKRLSASRIIISLGPPAPESPHEQARLAEPAALGQQVRQDGSTGFVSVEESERVGRPLLSIEIPFALPSTPSGVPKSFETITDGDSSECDSSEGAGKFVTVPVSVRAGHLEITVPLAQLLGSDSDGFWETLGRSEGGREGAAMNGGGSVEGNRKQELRKEEEMTESCAGHVPSLLSCLSAMAPVHLHCRHCRHQLTANPLRSFAPMPSSDADEMAEQWFCGAECCEATAAHALHVVNSLHQRSTLTPSSCLLSHTSFALLSSHPKSMQSTQNASLALLSALPKSIESTANTTIAPPFRRPGNLDFSQKASLQNPATNKSHDTSAAAGIASHMQNLSLSNNDSAFSNSHQSTNGSSNGSYSSSAQLPLCPPSMGEANRQGSDEVGQPSQCSQQGRNAGGMQAEECQQLAEARRVPPEVRQPAEEHQQAEEHLLVSNLVPEGGPWEEVSCGGCGRAVGARGRSRSSTPRTDSWRSGKVGRSAGVEGGGASESLGEGREGVEGRVEHLFLHMVDPRPVHMVSPMDVTCGSSGRMMTPPADALTSSVDDGDGRVVAAVSAASAAEAEGIREGEAAEAAPEADGAPAELTDELLGKVTCVDLKWPFPTLATCFSSLLSVHLSTPSAPSRLVLRSVASHQPLLLLVLLSAHTAMGWGECGEAGKGEEREEGDGGVLEYGGSKEGEEGEEGESKPVSTEAGKTYEKRTDNSDGKRRSIGTVTAAQVQIPHNQVGSLTQTRRGCSGGGLRRVVKLMWKAVAANNDSRREADTWAAKGHAEDVYAMPVTATELQTCLRDNSLLLPPTCREFNSFIISFLEV
ncbi:hypothetical protein CLOP_g15111 [Closterium sp. NIES-67]|nr:hypothetical protein CLOP_g15111 [Closterium sp. NIES-67]